MPATTVTTYISDIACAHSLKQVNETIKSFLVVKALEGLRRKTGGTKADIRAPIATTKNVSKFDKNLPKCI
ncbi:hypothetical protein DPMN_125128 [Dreissena polymorpha]|uniref:Uncharacterized protein n=1 Tax=Dreissena polymorpha TaxID=45954 RepID=A0A9D4GUK1_DREPO|nr:hypothetical protein DPMN_125128 [Dreissena polymorpha]